MLAVYTICTIVGGGFVLLSSFLGGDGESDGGFDKDFDKDFDFDADADADVDVDADMDVDADADADGDIGDGAHVHAGAAGDVAHGTPTWNPFLSFKFWTFAMCFFGVVGLLLTWMGLPLIAQLGAAIPMGMLTGSSVSFAMHKLKHTQISSAVTERDLIGMEVRVVLPVSSARAGKVSLEARGRLIEYIAETDEVEAIQRDDRAVIISLENGRARVVRTTQFLPE